MVLPVAFPFQDLFSAFPFQEVLEASKLADLFTAF